ncbi:pentatricopeptide repeat-containing protein At3g49740-like isoform X1 [Corylus avellana]|uniref:pentatricopeptide repeat-containing protein At3g49740-like isoform X1 n=1 Tax=Corylus avellana TaxID=13451 RepID=UPI001E202383|nr:pentatricopeptide repeat-containing protein At3g49740-like isoform X1 [Corylus avellana]
MKLTLIKSTAKQQRQLVKLNQLLAKLTRSNRCSDCLRLFTQIHSSQFPKPDHYTFSAAITACANLRETAFGNQLHAHAVSTGLRAYPHVANTLLSLYAKAEDLDSVRRVFDEIENPDVYSWTTVLSACTKLGCVEDAWEVFDKMPRKEVAVWNAMITGCVENGYTEVAVRLFSEMHRVGVRHDNYSFASVLSACSVKALGLGRQLHSLVFKTGYLVRASVVNALLTMYFNCGRVADAYEVFEEVETEVYDQITFNVMIDGLLSVGRNEEALEVFREMQEASLSPTELTFVSVMGSCSSARVGHQVHAETIKMGFEACTSVSNATITMYSSCGDLHAAQMVFERLEEKDLVSWNTMISSYAQGNFGKSAILAYMQMQRAGTDPDEFSFGSLLARSECLEIVEMMHALASKNGLLLQIQVSNALVSGYSKHGKIKQAYQIFHNIYPRNLISWNTIIAGSLLNGCPIQGLEQFSQLLNTELKPDVYTLSLVLSICASISSLQHGKQVHGYIVRSGLFSETSLGNALLTAYAKCGVLDWSLRVFNAMVERDTVSWNALISAYAQHGQGEDAVNCFEAMQDSSGVEPDQATFTAVLSACSHAGLVDDGSRIFNYMVKNYGMIPGVDHFSCIVDLLGRGGYLDEAERIMKSKHVETHPNIWWTLFSACAAHGNIRLARIIAGFLLETEGNNPSIYVLLSNIYAAVGQWEESAKVRELIKKTGVMKQPGCSWIGS